MTRFVRLGLVAALVTLAACTQKKEDLKSPCVGTEKAPCERRSVNGPFLS